MGTLDAYLVALDAKTGRVVWETKVLDYQQRVRYSAGPIAADGKVLPVELQCGYSITLLHDRP